MKTIKEQTQEILTANGLDFNISKRQLQVLDVLGNPYPTPYYGLINDKTDEVINTVKKGYTVSQNEEIVELVLKGMESFGATLEVSKAGSLNGGRKVFLQLGIEGLGKVANDVVKRFVTIIDSNDGSTGLSIGIGDLTMSCSNQFFKFYKKGEAKFRHTATIAQKLQTIPFLIETALSESLRQIETYNAFASTEVSKSLADAMVKHVLGYDRNLTALEVMVNKSQKSINIMDEMYNHIEKEMAQKGQNLWGLHSGITSFTTHVQSAEKKETKGKPKRANYQIENLLVGASYKMNQASLKFAEKQIGILETA